MVLILCTFSAHSLMMFYIRTEFYDSLSKDFRITDPNSGVDARVDGRMDGRTHERTENQVAISGSLKDSRVMTKGLFYLCK